MKRSFWVPSLLLGLVMAAISSPASAVFYSCSDICNCAVLCSHPCREYLNGPLLTCAITGDCIGGKGCSLASAESAIFVPESTEPTPEAPAASPETAPAEPAR